MAIPHTQKSLLLGVYFLYKIRWLWQYFFIQNDVVFCLCNIFNIKILIFCLQKPKNVRREFVLVLNSVCLSVSGFKCFPIHFLTDLKNFWIVFFLAVHMCTVHWYNLQYIYCLFSYIRVGQWVLSLSERSVLSRSFF